MNKRSDTDRGVAFGYGLSIGVSIVVAVGMLIMEYWLWPLG